MGKRNGTQGGDPVKGAHAMWKIAKLDDPPLRVALGSDSYQIVMDKIKEYQEGYPKYEELSRSTDIDE